MLERIHIENYKCLRDVTVDLGDLTILIGPNDSGKSSFLEVIQSIGTIIQLGNINGVRGDHSLANLVWRKDAGRHIIWEVAGTADGHRFVYHLEMPVDPRPLRENLEWDGATLLCTKGLPSGQSHLVRRRAKGTTTSQP